MFTPVILIYKISDNDDYYLSVGCSKDLTVLGRICIVIKIHLTFINYNHKQINL